VSDHHDAIDVRQGSPDSVGEQLRSLRNAAVEARNRLSDRWSSTVPEEDPRIVTARHLKATISSAYLAWNFLTEEMALPDWWRLKFGEIPPAVQDELDDFAVFVTAGLMILSFSLFESSLRRIARELAVEAQQPFSRLVGALFEELAREGWTPPEPDTREFLLLFANVRNLLHNNGVFQPPDRRDREVIWRGKTYAFQVGKSAGFIEWGFNISLVAELVILNEALMEAPPVAALGPIA
jgi:hypothetical protein